MAGVRYRIVDATDNEILANNLTLEQAHETLDLLEAQYPGNKLEIESYTYYPITGLGRDPDLH